jgi:glyoxylase-like metal-dependent hydrolase (beta-lactamase superfamily II)
MEIYSINTGYFMLDGGAMFGVVPKSLWTRVYPSNDDNLIPLAMRCLLIVHGNRNILVDNGIGDKQDKKFFSHYFLYGVDTLEKSLAKHGLTLNDITDVLLTHLHFDHAGGSIRKSATGEGYEPAFPNADYWISESQWQWATQPNQREKASFLKENIYPIQESWRLKLFSTNFNLIEGVEIRLFDGHTVGQAIPFITLNNRTIVFMADLIPTSAHIPLPYIMSYDTQPLLTLKEKEEFLNEAAENQYILFFEHDHMVECCTVEKTDKGFKACESGSLRELITNNVI